MVFKKMCFSLLYVAGVTFIAEVTLAASYLETVAQIKLLGKYSGKENRWTLEEDAKAYFQAFPDRFESFVDAFGYKDMVVEDEDGARASNGSVAGLLSDDSSRYVSLYFATSDFVEKKDFIDKSLKIAKGGYWQVDAVNYFQYELTEDIKKNKKEYIEVMKGYPEARLNSILRFLRANNECCADALDISWLTREICLVDNTRKFCSKEVDLEEILSTREEVLN